MSAPAAPDLTGALVLVTGASSGIGSALARGLAAAGADLVLVARRADRLAALADELRAAHRTEVTVLPRDLAAPDAGPALRAELSSRGPRVTGLVNNAGFGSGLPFGREDPARLEAMPAEEERGRERVLCVSPSSTGTEFFDVAGTPGAGGGFARRAAPADVAAAVLRVLARRGGPAEVVPHDRAVTVAARLLPRTVLRGMGAMHRRGAARR